MTDRPIYRDADEDGDLLEVTEGPQGLVLVTTTESFERSDATATMAWADARTLRDALSAHLGEVKADETVAATRLAPAEPREFGTFTHEDAEGDRLRVWTGISSPSDPRVSVEARAHEDGRRVVVSVPLGALLADLKARAGDEPVDLDRIKAEAFTEGRTAGYVAGHSDGMDEAGRASQAREAAYAEGRRAGRHEVEREAIMAVRILAAAEVLS